LLLSTGPYLKHNAIATFAQRYRVLARRERDRRRGATPGAIGARVRETAGACVLITRGVIRRNARRVFLAYLK
jgi:hypothetical protein